MRQYMYMVCFLSALVIFSACKKGEDKKPEPVSKVVGKEVEYKDGNTVLKGYMAYDSSLQGKRPGILVVHEWWGHNDYARKRANMLAEMGYTALAVDMYGDGKQANHPDDAKKFASEVMKNMDSAKKRFLAALDILKKHETVDGGKIAAIGYCFGGGVVLNMVRMGVDLKGVASFHGTLGAGQPAKPGSIKAKILVCNGDDDKMTTKDQIDKFKDEMKKAGAPLTFISYPGAKHAFTNPDADALGAKFKLPLGYNAEADKKSWADMQKFMKELF